MLQNTIVGVDIMKEIKNKKYDMSIFQNMDIDIPEEIKKDILKLINEKESGYIDKDKFKTVRIKE